MDSDLNHLMSQKAIADCNMLRASLANSVKQLYLLFQEDMIKTLRTEKDYYSRQLDNLRKELETVKMSMPPSQNMSSQSICLFDAPRETMN